MPEADIKSQIGVISDLSNEREKLVGELKQLQTTLQETEGKSSAEAKKLQQEIRNKEEQLRATKRELADKTRQLNYPVTGLDVSVPSTLSSSLTFNPLISNMSSGPVFFPSRT